MAVNLSQLSIEQCLDTLRGIINRSRGYCRLYDCDQLEIISESRHSSTKYVYIITSNIYIISRHAHRLNDVLIPLVQQVNLICGIQPSIINNGLYDHDVNLIEEMRIAARDLLEYVRSLARILTNRTQDRRTVNGKILAANKLLDSTYIHFSEFLQQLENKLS